MKSNVQGVWLLMLGVLLALGSVGCGDDEGEDSPRDSGVVDAGRDGGARPDDGGRDGDGAPDGSTDGGWNGGGDAGRDGGPDAGRDGGPPAMDGGDDGGTDGGSGEPDAGKDAGTGVRHRAHVRFVNAFLGSKSNPSDQVDRPWDPFKVDLYVGDTKPFAAVSAGNAAVTAFQEVELTGTTQEVRLAARNAEGDASSPELASHTFTLAEGDWVTVVGSGSLLQVGQERPDTPRLVVLKDHAFTAVTEPDTVRVRFMSADRVISATARRRFANEAGVPFENNTVEAYSADTVENGVAIASDTSRVAIVGTTPAFTPAQSGWLYYSLPEGTLRAGQAYYAINTGEDRRTLADEGASALLLISAKQDVAVRLKRGPLVYFFNGVLPATPGGTPPSLQVIQGSFNVATAITHGAAPKVADLPVTASGLSVRVTVSGQPAQGVIESAEVGPLEAGRRYLGVLCGRQGASPMLTVVKDEFAEDAPQSPFLRIVHCSASAPTPLDFGAYSFQADGASRDTFTPLLTGLSYPLPTQPVTGVAFAPPASASTPAYTWLGVKTAGDAPVERTIRGRVLGTPSFLILMGEWDSTLTYRTLNTRLNTWGSSGPNDATFSPLTPPQ
ncbi:DUF4397 domain-containing protein [Myxococcus stipitatus]|uniref:DUF4397 domain-containing protein n=1 Tax=Myxococcus stipitatus TaxID=83455 RepID=UPI0030D53BD7